MNSKAKEKNWAMQAKPSTRFPPPLLNKAKLATGFYALLAVSVLSTVEVERRRPSCPRYGTPPARWAGAVRRSCRSRRPRRSRRRSPHTAHRGRAASGLASRGGGGAPVKYIVIVSTAIVSTAVVHKAVQAVSRGSKPYAVHLDTLGQQRHELLAVHAAREGRRAPVHGGAARDATARVDEDAELPLPRARWRLHHEQLAVGQPCEEGRAVLGREGEELPHCTCAKAGGAAHVQAGCGARGAGRGLRAEEVSPR